MAIYTTIGIIAVIAVTTLLTNQDKRTQEPSISTTNQVEESKRLAVERFQKQFCGVDSKANSNKYVSEIQLPNNCEMPLGVFVDTNNSKVWYLSTKNGTLGSYDFREKRFDKGNIIPLWKSRYNPIESSQVWTMKTDQNGGIWFTDEKQNSLWKFDTVSGTFEIFKIPATSESFGSIYPVSLDFDSNGNIYFVGIRSPSLWFGNTTEMSNNTYNGITEIPLPLQGFQGVDSDLISTGSIAVDNKDEAVWITMLAFGYKGQILKFYTNNQTFDTFDLPSQLNSPVGIVLDDKRNLWVTDHGTSIFFNFLPDNKSITEFATSKASERIFGRSESFTDGAYTLPYWIHKADDGSLWFNEHTGNKIAHFLPNNNTLIEYWIPSQNRLFSQCDPESTIACGIANALQLSVGSGKVSGGDNDVSNSKVQRNNEVWFTEWSENKIGRVDHSRTLPFSVQTSEQEITIRKGDSASIDVFISPSSVVSEDMVNLTASATFTPTGDFGNSSWSYSEESVLLTDGKTKSVKFVISPSSDLSTGRYMLMLGAQDSAITYLKAIAIDVV